MDLLTIAIFAWFMTKFVLVEGAAAVKGRPSPAHERWKAKRAGDGREWGVKTFFQQLTADALAEATVRRQRKARERAELAEDEEEERAHEREQQRQQRRRERHAGDQEPDDEEPEILEGEVVDEPTRNDTPEEPEMSNGADAGSALDTTIAHLKAIIAWGIANGTAGGEGFRNSNAAAGVGPSLIGALSDYQQGVDLMTATARKTLASFEAQKRVQEAYDQTPDAGDKNYQTSGR